MSRFTGVLAASLIALGLGGCDDDAPERSRDTGVAIYGDPRARIAREDLERGRMDPSWRRVVQLDTLPDGETGTNPESWEDISPRAVNSVATYLPLHGDVAGPSVLRVQVLLDRALFSPGIIDGRWGKNTEKAVYWLQQREGLRRTGRVDQATFQRLRELGGTPPELIRVHALTAEDVSGPFITIPEDIYEQADLRCMCFESLAEKLGEMFHTSPALLEQLNPGVDLNAVGAGDRIAVPHVRDAAAPAAGTVDRLVISDGGFYLHAVDAEGRILYHFPTTLGSSYSPSPTGDYRVTGTAQDPNWHYQPDLLEGIPDDEEDALIPAGPNNAVGVVWMQLSKPHYGIHGTNAPETIGYATSNGCVRLTNWDARFLSERITQGVLVEFRDVDNPGGVSED
jgi:lipoprotein-anchoring transpeptidase ErfK/SrfK